MKFYNKDPRNLYILFSLTNYEVSEYEREGLFQTPKTIYKSPSFLPNYFRVDSADVTEEQSDHLVYRFTHIKNNEVG